MQEALQQGYLNAGLAAEDPGLTGEAMVVRVLSSKCSFLVLILLPSYFICTHRHVAVYISPCALLCIVT